RSSRSPSSAPGSQARKPLAPTGTRPCSRAGSRRRTERADRGGDDDGREDVGRRAVLGARIRVGPGLGLHRPPEGAARADHRALREGDAGEREALRRRAAVPAPESRAPRRARLPRADRAREVRRARREPRRVLDGVRDDRALRVRVDGDVLRDAHRRGQRDHAPRHGRADREVHQAAPEREDRHALLLGPRDGLALLVPGVLGRRACERRLPGPQEGVVDDVGRVRGLLRRPDDEPRLHRLRRPVGVRDRRRARAVAAVALGRSRPARQPVRAGRGAEHRGPGRAARRADRRRRDLERRVGRPVVPDRLLVRVERHHARRDRHREAAHDEEAPRRRRHARRRLPDDPGLRRRGGHGHERLPALRPLRRAGDGQGDERQHEDPEAGRARARQLPALGVADQVRGCEERRPPRRQDAARLRRLRLQARHGARAVPSRREGRLGDGADERGPAPVRRQGRAARVRVARLLEPDVQPPRGRERAEEARREGQTGARGAAARRGGRAGREGTGRGALMVVAGLLPRDPTRETYRVAPGATRVVSVEPGDRLVVRDVHGGQRAHLVSRELGLAADLFGPESARGSEEAFDAARAAVVSVTVPAGEPVVHGGVPATDVLIEIRRARPRDELEPALPEPLAEPRLDFEVPRASARAYEIRAGEYLQVIDVKGRQCSDLLAFHAEKLQQGLERGLDSTTTRSLMGSAYPQPGLYAKFFDQDQVPLLEVVRDTVGRHDTFGLACYAKYYEDLGYFGHVNCTDNFNEQLLPYTIAPRRGWPALNLFYHTSFDPGNLLVSDEPWSRPGDYVLLRAFTDLVCLSSACPDDIDPANAWNPTEIHVRVYPAKERFSAAIAHRVTPDAPPKLTKDTGFRP